MSVKFWWLMQCLAAPLHQVGWHAPLAAAHVRWLDAHCRAVAVNPNYLAAAQMTKADKQ